jgi:hypothetical protein
MCLISVQNCGYAQKNGSAMPKKKARQLPAGPSLAEDSDIL